MTATPTCEQEGQGMAATTDPVRTDRHGAVALVTIVHSPVNAISRAVAVGILEELTAAEADPACRALVLTGEGDRYFSAGADLTELAGDAPGDLAGSIEVTGRLEASRLPVLAAVNGIAYGGGCEIALACDLRICAEDARFGQPEIKLGIIPGWGGTQRLPRLVGRGPALEMLLTGDPIDAARALSCGLVTRVVPPGRLGEEALALAGLLAQRPPLAVAAVKRAVRRGSDGSLAGGLRREREEFARLLGSEDAREGLSAFLEKRPPTWRGR
jgi:enoyl-CoA hydratase/carnithine racemase